MFPTSYDQAGAPLATVGSHRELPEKGQEYTIRKVVKTPYGKVLRLEEIKNKKFYFDNIEKHQEPIFGKYRFKLVSKE